MSDVEPREPSSRKALRLLADFTGPLTLCCFGVVLWAYGASENLFSFAAWASLDILMGMSMYKAGAKKQAVLPVVYGITCAFVVAMIYRNGQWQWTNVETICLAGTAFALFCWYRFGPVPAVIAFGVALLAASVPILVSTYHSPQTWEWWLWIGAGVSSGLGLHLSRPWTLKNIADWLFVAISMIVTVIMLVLLLSPLFL